MVRTRRINSLNILMNGYLVGTWLNLPSGAMNFQYAEAWLETDGARPISLSMPLRRQHYEGDLVYNFFDTSLPEDFPTHVSQPIFEGMLSLAKRSLNIKIWRSYYQYG